MLGIVEEKAEIAYEIRRSRRAKRVRLTVRPEGVRVSAPPWTRAATIRRFVESKRPWIERRSRELAEEARRWALPESLSPGVLVPLRGDRVELHVLDAQAPVAASAFASGLTSASGRRSKRASVELAGRPADRIKVLVPGTQAKSERQTEIRRALVDWLKLQALADAERWVGVYAPRLDVRPTKIRIGNQKTLWGSCSARGTISLNWRLVTLPEALFEYVVVHELCHLVERNHGLQFWSLVGSLLPDYGDRRAALRRRTIL